MQLLELCAWRAPFVKAVSPAGVSPLTGGSSLSVSWAFTGLGSSIITAAAANGPSNAVVELESGPAVYTCAAPTVSSAAISANAYNESLSCTLPAYLPASNYTLWVCVDPFGCGYRLNYQVPLTVTGLAGSSATASGPAGGLVVTLLGSGFDTNATRVSVRFGDSPCTVLTSSQSGLTCRVGAWNASTPLPSATALGLFVTPTIGAAEASFPSTTFTYDPTLTSAVSSVSPARGSTAGGTPITIRGSGFVMSGSDLEVSIGSTACTNVTVVDATTITCTSAAPPTADLRTQQPVRVWQADRGFASGSVSYSYVDVWSRASTWGAGPLPKEGDSVYIKAGTTVLLDVSPPPLNLIIVEGNLVFDHSQAYLNLQANYILVFGGALTVAGPDGMPYPATSRANITLMGTPTSRELPQYGAKTIAVRDGVVTLNGQPKLPVYTVLNQTADVGATSIKIVGQVNWKVRDPPADYACHCAVDAGVPPP